MRQAFSAVAVLILLVLATPVQAQSYYIGVNGGYSDFRDTRFAYGDGGDTRVIGSYEGGEAAFGFANALGDFSLSGSTALVGGFGFGVAVWSWMRMTLPTATS